MTGCRIKEIEHCTNESLLSGTSTECQRYSYQRDCFAPYATVKQAIAFS